MRLLVWCLCLCLWGECAKVCELLSKHCASPSAEQEALCTALALNCDSGSIGDSSIGQSGDDWYPADRRRLAAVVSPAPLDRIFRIATCVDEAYVKYDAGSKKFSGLAIDALEKVKSRISAITNATSNFRYEITANATFDGMVQSVANGQFDMYWAGTYITPVNYTCNSVQAVNRACQFICVMVVAPYQGSSRHIFFFPCYTG